MANSADPEKPTDLKKPTDLDLHCLQRQGISGLSRTRVNNKLVRTSFCYINISSLEIDHELPAIIIYQTKVSCVARTKQSMKLAISNDELIIESMSFSTFTWFGKKPLSTTNEPISSN